ncbi:hypothetical protein V8J88_05490 [Massilia sp. W12]|uniref:hypothetical protein n=1 Tax=Massilia sp. W12 TaxID=3126507 RepID=UPI0030D4831D
MNELSIENLEKNIRAGKILKYFTDIFQNNEQITFELYISFLKNNGKFQVNCYKFKEEFCDVPDFYILNYNGVFCNFEDVVLYLTQELNVDEQILRDARNLKNK